MTTPDYPSESKAYPGQKPRPRGRDVSRWFLPFKRDVSYWGFVLNRVAGLGLVLYLLLHMVALSQLLGGEAGWDRFIDLTTSPVFLTLDVILLAGIIGHGLNGLRVALVGSGLLVKWQRQLFYVLMTIAVVLLIIGGILIFTA
ncbi:MAG: hypothetical protein WBH90_08345 [Aggregatilineales bacterium]|mgnify:FL=1|jgi:succinate dehydrogenase / fumarate reductase cytochrome b subunit